MLKAQFRQIPILNYPLWYLNVQLVSSLCSKVWAYLPLKRLLPRSYNSVCIFHVNIKKIKTNSTAASSTETMSLIFIRTAVTLRLIDWSFTDCLNHFGTTLKWKSSKWTAYFLPAVNAFLVTENTNAWVPISWSKPVMHWLSPSDHVGLHCCSVEVYYPHVCSTTSLLCVTYYAN